jgi:3-hydroxyisobutyrate dehydrogenase-like beta-hydroxyacid dehydrogenase
VDAQVAVVGLGKMGSPIAERILDAGYALSVYNRTASKAQPLVERGAARLAAAADALQAADVCLTMLADDGALESTAAEILGGARRGTTLVDMSTVSVAASERVARAAADAGVEYLRAPVSGNPGVVIAGNLTIVVSGPEEVARELDPLLRSIGPTIYYVGDGEAARVVKLALQVLIGGIAELLAEALVLGERAGVDRAKLLEVIGNSAVGSPFVKYKTEPLLRDDYSATFTTAMMLKDVDLVLELAASHGASLPLTRELRELLADAAATALADRDFMALYLRLSEREGAIA